MQPGITLLNTSGLLRKDSKTVFDENFTFAVNEDFDINSFKRYFTTLFNTLLSKVSKTKETMTDDFHDETEEEEHQTEENKDIPEGSEWVNTENPLGIFV